MWIYRARKVEAVGEWGRDEWGMGRLGEGTGKGRWWRRGGGGKMGWVGRTLPAPARNISTSVSAPTSGSGSRSTMTSRSRAKMLEPMRARRLRCWPNGHGYIMNAISKLKAPYISFIQNPLSFRTGGDGSDIYDGDDVPHLYYCITHRQSHATERDGARRQDECGADDAIVQIGVGRTVVHVPTQSTPQLVKHSQPSPAKPQASPQRIMLLWGQSFQVLGGVPQGGLPSDSP